MPLLETILGGTLIDSIKGLIGQFRASPEDKLKLQELVDQNANTIALKQLDLQAKLQDAVTEETKSAAAIITAEAQSQSWLPRNVRPLLLLLWGLAMTFNIFVPIVARFWLPTIQPLILPDWLYKLTAIGFTGYVTARTWEKVTNSDN